MGFLGALTGKDAKKAMFGAAEAKIKGADQYQAWANRGIDETKSYLSDALKFLSPQIETGNKAGGILQSLIGMGSPEDSAGAITAIQQNPAYQFRLKEGLKATERLGNARGSLYSGGTLKALQERGDGIASEEINNTKNTLLQLLGFGNTAATNSASMTQGAGGTIAQLLANIGNAQMQAQFGAGEDIASGKIAQSNAMNNIFSQGLGLLTAPLGGGTAGTSMLGKLFGM